MYAPLDDRSPGPAHFHSAPQRGLALVYKIETHMGGAVFAPLQAGAILGQLDGAARNVGLREPAVPGKELDRMAIAVAGRKIHAPVNAAGIRAQGPFDETQGLHKILPIVGAQEAKTGYAVADGDLVRRLILAVQMDKLLDGQPLLNEPLFKPAACEVQGRALARQPLAEFRHERA